MINFLEVSQRIDLIRKQKGWTQEQLASALDLSQPAISKYLKERIPPAETLLKLAQFGNTTIEWILTGQKSYFYQQENTNTVVRENPTIYDAEINLAKKIAKLTPVVRQAIISLVDFAFAQGK